MKKGSGKKLLSFLILSIMVFAFTNVGADDTVVFEEDIQSEIVFEEADAADVMEELIEDYEDLLWDEELPVEDDDPDIIEEIQETDELISEPEAMAETVVSSIDGSSMIVDETNVVWADPEQPDLATEPVAYGYEPVQSESLLFKLYYVRVNGASYGGPIVDQTRPKPYLTYYFMNNGYVFISSGSYCPYKISVEDDVTYYYIIDNPTETGAFKVKGNEATTSNIFFTQYYDVDKTTSSVKCNIDSLELRRQVNGYIRLDVKCTATGGTGSYTFSGYCLKVGDTKTNGGDSSEDGNLSTLYTDRNIGQEYDFFLIATDTDGTRSEYARVRFIVPDLPPVYEIKYNLDGGDLPAGVTNPDTYAENETVTLKNPEREGYIFAGWTGTDLSGPTMTVTIPSGSTKEKRYTATWTPVEYKIRYNLNGGNGENPTSYSIKSSNITLKAPSRPGYTFDGWTGSDLTEVTTQVTIPRGSTGDRSYTANWTVIPPTVIKEYSAFVGGKITLDMTELKVGSSAICTSSDTSVADISEGVVTAKAIGTATIRVVSAKKPQSVAHCVIHVISEPMAKLNATKKTIYTKGNPSSFTLKPVVENGKLVSVSYSSSEPKTAAVDLNGKVTTKGAGTAIITAEVNAENEGGSVTVSLNCKVTVKKPTLSVSPTSVTLKKGKSKTLTVKSTPSAAATYTSSNKKIATVNSKGKITAKKKGSCKVTVKCNGITKTVNVTVK